MSEYERGCGDCAENGTDKRVSPCLECYSAAGRPNWRAAGSIRALRALAQENDRLRARIAELEAALAAEREVSAARLAALNLMHSEGLSLHFDSMTGNPWGTIDDDQSAADFYADLYAAVGQPVGPREGEHE